MEDDTRRHNTCFQYTETEKQQEVVPSIHRKGDRKSGTSRLKKPIQNLSRLCMVVTLDIDFQCTLMSGTLTSSTQMSGPLISMDTNIQYTNIPIPLKIDQVIVSTGDPGYKPIKTIQYKQRSLLLRS